MNILSKLALTAVISINCVAAVATEVEKQPVEAAASEVAVQEATVTATPAVEAAASEAVAK